jgi:ATP-dependent Lon protease
MLPKIREQVNFSTEDIIIPDDTIEYVITKFTKGEDGVRNLKRCMEIIYTKLNLFRLVKSDSELLTKEINIKVEFPFTVTKKDVDILVKDDEAMNQSFMAMYT